MSKLKTNWKKLSLAKKVAVVFPLLLLVLFIGWRQWRIWSIPDIGEPFDKKAFLEPFQQEDLENAYDEYRKAGVIGFSLNLRTEEQWDQYDAAILNWDSANWRLDQWVNENEEFLTTCRTATASQYGFEVSPDLLTLMTLLPVDQDLRNYARSQLLEASRNVSLGEIEEAWVDYRALFQLSRQMRSNCIIPRLVGIAIHALVAEPFSYFLASSDLGVNELRKIQQELNDIYSSMPPASVSIKAEYWMRQKAIVSQLKKLGVLSSILKEKELTVRCNDLVVNNWLSECDIPRPERAVLIVDRHNPFWNRITGSQLIPEFYYEYFETDGKQLSGEPLLKTEISSEDLADHLRKMMMGAFVISIPDLQMGSSLEASDRDQSRQFMMQLQIALQIYHREQGDFPERLELLVPDYINEVPYDPFGKGEPLRYRREGKHAVIYSIGLDGVDDGGPLIEDQDKRGELWRKGDPYYEVYAPGTKAPIEKLKPAKAELP